MSDGKNMRHLIFISREGKQVSGDILISEKQEFPKVGSIVPIGGRKFRIVEYRPKWNDKAVAVVEPACCGPHCFRTSWQDCFRTTLR